MKLKYETAPPFGLPAKNSNLKLSEIKFVSIQYFFFLIGNNMEDQRTSQRRISR